jgi:hypothetical protein
LNFSLAENLDLFVSFEDFRWKALAAGFAGLLTSSWSESSLHSLLVSCLPQECRGSTVVLRLPVQFDATMGTAGAAGMGVAAAVFEFGCVWWPSVVRSTTAHTLTAQKAAKVLAANAPGAASAHTGGRGLRKFAVENATTLTCGPGAIPVSHRECSVGLKLGNCGSRGMTETACA